MYNAQLAQVIPGTLPEANLRMLNRSIRKLKQLKKLTLPNLDTLSFYILLSADAPFANHQDLSSQLGFIIIQKNKYDKASIIHYGFWKWHQVTRSASGAEIYAFNHCLGFVISLSNDVSLMLHHKVKTLMFTDAKCLFDATTKLVSVSEKCLFIDLAAVPENSRSCELSNVAHVTSNFNVVNLNTKDKVDRTMIQELKA